VSTLAVVITVIFIFFLVGVLVGVAAVYALSVRRADRADHPTNPDHSTDPDGPGKPSGPADGNRRKDTRWPF
jgi:hypothetical protein